MLETIETEWITMPDGTRLAARIWLPEGARAAPVPAVLEYIPYRRRDHTRARDETMHPPLAEAGYACLRVDMRGSGDSEGLMLDEYTDIETRDGADVIAWIAAQDWCDGNVAMVGKSWGAFTALQVAALRPPALKAIAPVMGTDNRFVEDIHFYNGVLASDNFWWGSIMQLGNAQPPDPAIVGDGWRDIWKRRLDAMTFWPAQWLDHQTRDANWQRGSVCEDYDAIQVPIYFFGGWVDSYRDTPFRLARNVSAPVKVMIGPWAHLYPHDGSPGPKIDFVGELVRFFDHYLKGRDTGLMDEPRMRFFMQDAMRPVPTLDNRPGYWVEEESWPSPAVHDARMWLNAGGLSEFAEPAAPMSICSPQTFGISGGDMTSFAIPGDLPGDGRIDGAGGLDFRSEPSGGAVAILGQAELHLSVAADQTQGFVAGLLYDEAPDGCQTLITRGFANLNHRFGQDQSVPVTPGETMQITVPLHATAYSLPAGHRLVVRIASTYWPILWPAPTPVTLTLAPGKSSLTLPVRSGNDPAARQLDPPPPIARPITTLKDGAIERTTTFDHVSGEVVARVYIDGGVFGPIGRIRLDDTGTELGDISERIYRVHPDDPLCASATMDQTSDIRRDDWHVRIHTKARMTASATGFHLTASVTCWDGDTQFHHVDWDHEIPRNGM